MNHNKACIWLFIQFYCALTYIKLILRIITLNYCNSTSGQVACVELWIAFGPTMLPSCAENHDSGNGLYTKKEKQRTDLYHWG